MSIFLFVKLCIAVLLTGLVVRHAHRLGSMLGVIDIPDGTRKLHSVATPQVGGLALLLTFLGYIVATSFTGSRPFDQDIAWVAVTFAFFWVGMKDDQKHLTPLFRLSALGLSVAILNLLDPTTMIAALNFTDLGITIGLGVWALPFTIFTILCFQNASNMADGMNCLFLGVGLIWVGLLLPWASGASFDILAMLGVSLAILIVANHRGRLFTGDSGTYFLAALIGLLSIKIYNDNYGTLSAGYLAICFLIPVIDMGRILVQRAVKTGHPFEPDHQHLQHLLLRITGSRTVTLAIYWALCALPALHLVNGSINTLMIGLSQLGIYAGIIVYLNAMHPARELKVEAKS